MQTRLATARIATALLALALPIAAHAAALTSGPSSTVVYVGGNDVVLKSSEGKLLNFTVPAGYKFSAGAKELSLAELKPGTSLTKPVAPGIDPKLVTAVAVVKGKVYAVTPPNALTLTLSDGAKELIVPAGTTFTVDGKRLPIAEIKPDMMVEATIVTTAAEGAATTAAAPTTPPLAGALLVANTPAAGEAELPLAGTNLPLFGLLGLCLLAAGAALLKLRPTTHA